MSLYWFFTIIRAFMTKCISYPRKAVCSEVHGLLYYYKYFFVEEQEGTNMLLV